MQLYVMPLAGGEPRQLTSLKEDVTQPAWSPDGATIAFVARVPDAAYDEEDDKRRQPRRFTRLQYKLRQRRLDRRPPAAPVHGRGGRQRRARPAHRRRLRGLGPRVVSRRRHACLRLGARARLGHRAGQRRVPRRRRRRRAPAAHPRRRQHRRRLVVAGRRPAGRAALPGVFDDPRHTQIADRRRRQRRASSCSPPLSTATAARIRSCASRSGTTPRSCSPWRTAATPTCTAWPPTVRAAPELVVGGECAVTGFDVAAGRLVYAADEPTRLSELFAARPRAAGGASRASATTSPPAASSPSPSASRPRRPTAPRSTPGS